MKEPQFNRRHFLRTAAGATAAATLPANLFAAASTARIPIGFLGLTHSHGPEKLRLLLKSADFEVVGVCEKDAAARRACEELSVKLLGEDELLERSRVIAVESAVRDHAPHALLALRAGKHVHVEKPPSVKLDDMRAMIAVAREKKLLLQSGYMWRYHPGFNAMIEAVRQGWLGEVFMVRGSITNNLAAARRPEWAEFKGGGMFELGSHLVDAVVRLMGKPKAVTPFLRHHGQFNDSLKDNTLAVLEFERALAVITNSTMQAAANPARSFEVLGNSGSAMLQPIEPPGLRFDFANPAGPYQKGLQTVPLTYRRYEADFVELAAAVRGERTLSVSLDDELLIHETVLKASDML
ncbi:MAG: Gfo/Idh/MocA family oxidoreductase [Verrucomicrobia bacterium]|nr:Gfo/Idh/MocA family oxidoreductase [Verrucomicrobiota bacterium]